MDNKGWTKTKTARRVYDRERKRHTFGWSDILRVVIAGPGAPAWHPMKSYYGSGYTTQYVPMSYQEKKDYLGYIIILDIIGNFASYMDKKAFWPGEIPRMFNDLRKDDQARFARAMSINLETLFKGLAAVSDVITQSGLIGVDFKPKK